MKTIQQKRDGGLTPNVLLLSSLFVSFLVLSNIFSIKLIEVDLARIPILGSWLNFKINPDCGILIFPFTYFLGDLITEVYGFKTSRWVIFCGLIATLVAAISIQFSVMMPASEYFEHQKEYACIFSSSHIIFIASCIAYFFGELFNSVILARMKQITSGRKLYLRSIVSTLAGNIIDTSLFCVIVFHSILPASEIIKSILFQTAVKMTFEFVLLPLTYLISGYLKRTDACDAYDFEWSHINPFALLKR